MSDWWSSTGQAIVWTAHLDLQACWTCALHRVAAPWDSSALFSALLPCPALLHLGKHLMEGLCVPQETAPD